jgi:DNA-binding beta-propeller fold protein YncE
MTRNSESRLGRGFVLTAAFAAIAVGIVLTTVPSRTSGLNAASTAASRRATGAPQLVGMEPLPETSGEMCVWEPAAASESEMLAAIFAQDQHVSADWETKPPGNADRPPARIIRDTYPTYSAIAINLEKDEVLLQDENLFGIKVFNRTDNTPPTAAFTEPKRRIAGGGVTKMEFNCGLYVDPKSGDIYSVTNDTIDTLTVFPWNAEGEMKPKRELYTPHGTFGISVDEDAGEMYLTVQHENSVVVYPKSAAGEDKPLRELLGPKTQLEDPHGVAVDYKNGLMFVSNHGNAIVQATSSGKFEPPSITVYPLKASGDTAPLRVIEGPRTRLDWPAGMRVDSEDGELYVANDGDSSITVFKTTDSGNAAPTRVIRGPKTHVLNPTDVYLDLKHNEVWAANMGNHSAVVFRRTADGDAAPLRIIRSAPMEKKALAIGNPGAVAYDSKRDEILAPN